MGFTLVRNKSCRKCSKRILAHKQLPLLLNALVVFQMIKTLYYLKNGINYFTKAQIKCVLETNRIFGQLNGFPFKMHFSAKCNSRRIAIHWFHIKHY